MEPEEEVKDDHEEDLEDTAEAAAAHRYVTVFDVNFAYLSLQNGS